MEVQLVTARFFFCLSLGCGIRTGLPLRASAASQPTMVLYRNFRIHQVFGANTDVGKTVFSAVLTLASIAAGRSTFYLKPVSTGPLTDADDRCVRISFLHSILRIFNRRRHIARYLPTNSSSYASLKCLYQFQDPTSPHLAAKNTSQVLVFTFSMALNQPHPTIEMA